MTRFEVCRSHDSEITVLRMEESFPARLCTDAILAIVENIDPPFLVVDLVSVEFINKQCLGDLVWMGTKLRATGGGLVLLNGNSFVREVIEPLPRKQQLDPASCSMFYANDHAEAQQWFDLIRSTSRHNRES